MLNESDITFSTQLVIDTFRSFRNELLNAHGNVEHTQKADYSQVTLLDVAVENELKRVLSTAYPDIGFYGEETGISGNSETYWLVDPIDGTSSFVRGLPYCTNMAALIHNDEAIASVIYDFITDTLYTANAGKGAFKNGEPLSVNQTRKPGNLLMYNFSPYKFNDLYQLMMTTGIKSVYPVGAAGHFYTLVAEGTIDGVCALHSKTGIYDNAPGLLLIQEAGGEIITFDDEMTLRSHEFVVGSPQLISVIKNSKAAIEQITGYSKK